MANGKKINDRASWIGGGTVFPEGVKTKSEPMVEGAGECNDYPDTSEKIVAMQKKNIAQLKKNPYRE